MANVADVKLDGNGKLIAGNDGLKLKYHTRSSKNHGVKKEKWSNQTPKPHCVNTSKE
jgi:hypothetical protein